MGDGGRDELFARWLAEHQAALLRIARTFATTREDRDDLLQELLLQLWMSTRVFRHECKESTWIYRVGLNAAMAWRRGERRRRALPVHSLSIVEPPAPEQPDALAHGEVIDRLYAQIYRLSKIDAALVLLYLEGLSYREISEILDLSESNVGVKLNRLREHLARSMQGVGDDQ